METSNLENNIGYLQKAQVCPTCGKCPTCGSSCNFQTLKAVEEDSWTKAINEANGPISQYRNVQRGGQND